MAFDISKLAPLAQPLLNPQADLAAIKAARAHGFTTLCMLLLGGLLIALQCFSQAFEGSKLGIWLGVGCAVIALVVSFLNSMSHNSSATSRSANVAALLQLAIQAAQEVETALAPAKPASTVPIGPVVTNPGGTLNGVPAPAAAPILGPVSGG